MSDYERLQLKLEAIEFGGVPMGVLIDDAELMKVLGIRQAKVFRTGGEGEVLSLEELYADEGPYRGLAVGVDKDKELTRAVLEWAIHVLPSGGQLVLVGEKRLGVQSFEKFLADKLEGQAKMPLKDIGRLSFWTKNASSEAPLPSLWKETKVELPWVSLTLVSLPGVFARGELDGGTAMLLDTLELPEKGKLLDLACGGGVIGAWAKKQVPAMEVTLTDIDANAVASARKTFEKNNLQAEAIHLASGFEALPKGERYDIITLNPPFHQGQRVDYSAAEELIRGARHFLANHGQLVIVANRFCPYEKTLKEVFGSFEQVREAGGFKVLRAVRG